MARTGRSRSGKPEHPPVLRCFYSRSRVKSKKSIQAAVTQAVKEAGLELIDAETLSFTSLSLSEHVNTELASSDCMIADISSDSVSVTFEIGAAQALGKPVILIAEEGASRRKLVHPLADFTILHYETDDEKSHEFKDKLVKLLSRFRNTPERWRQGAVRGRSAQFLVDWERLGREDAENLCRELLAQMGFRRLDWAIGSREVDLVAELPKKDPDGFEYKELWMVNMGRNAPIEMLIDMAVHDPEFFVDRFLRFSELSERLENYRTETPITFLIISWEDGPAQGRLLDVEHRSIKTHRKSSRLQGGVRTRIWDRAYLTSLVQQYPQLGYKYFSEEGRSKSKYRKTPEELYLENTQLSGRLALTVEELKDERTRRVRVERDALWKDISFAAAHKLGNPVFAIETILAPLEKRINEGRTEEALEMSHRIQGSVEKAKEIVNQFKSLALSQKIEVSVTALAPILDESCQMASDQGVECNIECQPEIQILGDVVRLGECFDELVRNALTWFDKDLKTIQIVASAPATPPLPAGLDSSKQFAIIHFRDNGPGIPIELKKSIFDAFVTTSPQGTGLGLALVRRIIDGHGGTILESGRPGEGADFEIYLPLAAQSGETQQSKIS